MAAKRAKKDKPKFDPNVVPLATSRRFYDRVEGKVHIREVFQLIGKGAPKGVCRFAGGDEEGFEAMLVNTDQKGKMAKFAPILREGVPVSLEYLLPKDPEFVWNNEFLKSAMIQSCMQDPTIETE